MIDTDKYKIILDEGILLDHYLLLCNVRDGKEIVKSKRIQGFMNLLHKKGYLEENILTEKALRLLGGTNTVPPSSAPKKDFHFGNWVVDLHNKCEDRLMEKKGMRQMRPKINGKAYPFLPNAVDLGKTLLRAVNHYKLTDFDKIEKTILSYIDKCAKSGEWFPILGYYIMKGGATSLSTQSMMVTDMESGEEESTDNASIHIV